MADEDKGSESTPATNQSEQVILNLLAKAGVTPDEVPESARRVMRRLAKENFKYREKIRDLEDKVIPDEAVVIQGDDAAKYKAFNELGLSAEEVKAKIEERDKFHSQLEAKSRQDLIRTAADTLNYKAKVLEDLVASRGLALELREVEVEQDGQKVKTTQPFVKVASSDSDFEALDNFADRELKDYLPALRSKEGHGDGVVQYPEQGGKGKAPEVDLVGKILDDTYVVPSKRNQTA